MKDLNYIHDLLNEFQINTASQKRILIIRMLSTHSSVTISSMEEKILQMFADHSIRLYMFQYPQEYLAVIDASFPLEQLQTFYRTLSDSIQIGIGRTTDLFKVSSSYDTARIALNSLSEPDCNYALFDELTLEILLGSINETAASEFFKRPLPFWTKRIALFFPVILNMNSLFPERVKPYFFIRIHYNTN